MFVQLAGLQMFHHPSFPCIWFERVDGHGAGGGRVHLREMDLVNVPSQVLVELSATDDPRDLESLRMQALTSGGATIPSPNTRGPHTPPVG